MADADQTAKQRMAEVLAAHEDFEGTTSGTFVCVCGYGLGDGTGDLHGRHRAHVAAALVAAGFGDVRQAGAEALAKAADKWQWGGWTMLTEPVKAGSVLAAAQVVTDWLRECAKNGGAR